MAHSGTALIDPYKIFEKISLSVGQRVADLGCGRTGILCFRLLKQLVTQALYMQSMWSKIFWQAFRVWARSGGFDNIQTVWSDIEQPGKTPIPAGTLDVCFCVNVLFQLKNKEGGDQRSCATP
jgi:hypothetical protein